MHASVMCSMCSIILCTVSSGYLLWIASSLLGKVYRECYARTSITCNVFEEHSELSEMMQEWLSQYAGYNMHYSTCK